MSRKIGEDKYRSKLNSTSEETISRRNEKHWCKTAIMFGLVVSGFATANGWRIRFKCWATGDQACYECRTFKDGLRAVLEAMVFIPN